MLEVKQRRGAPQRGRGCHERFRQRKSAAAEPGILTDDGEVAGGVPGVPHASVAVLASAEAKSSR